MKSGGHVVCVGRVWTWIGHEKGVVRIEPNNRRGLVSNKSLSNVHQRVRNLFMNKREFIPWTIRDKRQLKCHAILNGCLGREDIPICKGVRAQRQSTQRV